MNYSARWEVKNFKIQNKDNATLDTFCSSQTLISLHHRWILRSKGRIILSELKLASPLRKLNNHLQFTENLFTPKLLINFSYFILFSHLCFIFRKDQTFLTRTPQEIKQSLLMFFIYKGKCKEKGLRTTFSSDKKKLFFPLPLPI